MSQLGKHGRADEAEPTGNIHDLNNPARRPYLQKKTAVFIKSLIIGKFQADINDIETELKRYENNKLNQLRNLIEFYKKHSDVLQQSVSDKAWFVESIELIDKLTFAKCPLCVSSPVCNNQYSCLLYCAIVHSKYMAFMALSPCIMKREVVVNGGYASDKFLPNHTASLMKAALNQYNASIVRYLLNYGCVIKINDLRDYIHKCIENDKTENVSIAVFEQITDILRSISVGSILFD